MAVRKNILLQDIVRTDVQFMYMALHIADTEALRRVLCQAVADRKLAEKRKGFRGLAYQIAAEARKRNLPPVTKKEIDDLWGMDELIGGD
jgi:hypothetical protein